MEVRYRRPWLFVDAYGDTPSELSALIDATIARTLSDVRYGRGALAASDPPWVLIDRMEVLRDNEEDAADLTAMREIWIAELS